MISDHAKQADQSWGGPTGGAEFDDEKAGEAIAEADAKDPAVATDDWATPNIPVDGEGNQPETAPAENLNWGAVDGAAQPATQPAPEPEDNNKSYADYLAEQAEKKLKLGTGVPEARKPNEGSKQDKKWAQAKPLSKDDDEEDYISGKGGKAKRERERKEKQTLEVDLRYVEPSRGGERGRGGRGRGDGYRGRGDGDYRGRGRGRGGGDGFRGRGDGDYRSNRGGGRGGRDGAQVNVADTSAFPSLGGS